MDRNTIAPIQKIFRKAENTTPVERSHGESDKVSLSGEAREMQKAEAERIVELSKMISDGTYEIDLERLAIAFIRKELF